MQPIQYRSVISFFVQGGKTSKEIIQHLREAYGAQAPSAATIKRWVWAVRRGRTELEDDHRVGRPVSARTTTNAAKLERLIMENRRISLIQLCDLTGLSRSTVQRIIREDLKMRKLSARWIPKRLTESQKHARVVTSHQLLTRCRLGRRDFYERLITCDETWIFHYDPESKRESMEWRQRGSAPPQKFKVSRTTKKIMMSVFWDCKGVIHIDYLEKGTTITGAYYAKLLEKVRQSIKEKRRGLLARGPLLQQDNAPSHNSHIAVASAKKCGFEILPHPPYSPDLAPSDYHLFGNLKKTLRGRHFTSDDELICAVESWFQGQNEEFFREGIEALENRWEKCIVVKGAYVEK